MKYIITRCASLAVLPAFLFLATAPAAADLDGVRTVYYNGHVITVDDSFSIAEAFTVTGDKFVAVGRSKDLLAQAGPKAVRVDLHGKTVLPGFEDGHVHILPADPNIEPIPLNHPKSMAEFLQRVSEVAHSRPAGSWLTFVADDWAPAQLSENRVPTLTELDSASPNNPLYIARGGQQVIVNSLALKAAGITTKTEPREGRGVVQKDPSTGALTGVLLSNAKYIVRDVIPNLPPDYDRVVAKIAEGNHLLNASGVTSAREASAGTEEIRAYEEAYKRGKLTVRMNVMFEPRARQDPLETVIKQMRDFGGFTGLGNDWMRIGGMKFFYDGAIESALLSEPYVTDANFFGSANFSMEKYTAMLTEAAGLGWSVGVHLVGDKAIADTLQAFAAVNRVHPIKPLRWALEHAVLGSEKHIDEIRSLGVIISHQERNLFFYSMPASKVWGMDRARQITPANTWLKNGIVVAGGSDQLDSPDRLNLQFYLMWSGITRDTEHLGVLDPEERVTREQAIRMHTATPAYLTFEEKEKGSIKPGMLADFIVISDDILKVPVDQIPNLKVEETFVGGRSVYQLGK